MQAEEARRARIAANEALYRAVNERIEDVSRTFAEVAGDESLVIVCECGDAACVEQIPIPIEEYEKVRSDPTLFIIVPGHEVPDVEDIVTHNDTFDVVCKHKGAGEIVARATDPRA